MEIIKSASGIVILIPMILLTIFYFYLYHSIFSVIYFKNTCMELIFEIVGCFALAAVTVGVVLKAIVTVFKFLGTVVVVIFKIVIVLGLIGICVYILYSLFQRKGMKKTEKTHSTESAATIMPESSNQEKTKCPECGEECSADDMFCNNCGNSLRKENNNAGF